MNLDKNTKALLYLMRCALQNKKPEPIPELDYESLYKLSSAHSVVAMTAMALESGELLTEQYTTAECIKKWKDARVKAVRKNILLDAEREQLLAYLEEIGAWYMPLKGSVLKELYPKLGMRQMADNDILFDATYQQLVKDFMVGRGYQVIDFARGNHDVYEKPPVYNFEFHTSLFAENSHPEWAAYYKNVYERLFRMPGTNHGCCFSDEDFYVYFLLHGYKHYDGSGTGIRFLTDIFVFLQKRSKALNWIYILAELKKLGIDEFEEKSRKLACKLFGKEEILLEDEEQEQLAYMMGSGTYGTMENHVSKELEKLQGTDKPVTAWTKVKYTFQRIFPGIEHMKQYSAFCRKHPWSFPFFWVVRWCRAATVRRKAIMQEFKAVRK